MIVIVDYGMGNLGSIQNMIKKIGAEAIISSQLTDIQKADKLVLPGVGSFDNGMRNIKELGLLDILNYKAMDQKIPVLGVCLGMQLIGRSSEEGVLPGLGWIPACTQKFSFDKECQHLKVPHMGWNTIEVKKNCYIFDNMYEEPRFYFVHSYKVFCEDASDILATTEYGGDFVSCVQHENIIGTQFHPEKSHKFGLKLFENFVKGE